MDFDAGFLFLFNASPFFETVFLTADFLAFGAMPDFVFFFLPAKTFFAGFFWGFFPATGRAETFLFFAGAFFSAEAFFFSAVLLFRGLPRRVFLTFFLVKTFFFRRFLTIARTPQI
ncbi:MAG TPA: hypothetical protein PLZ86_03280 [bacterium]|nr:hypothetical protein [bacterium]